MIISSIIYKSYITHTVSLKHPLVRSSCEFEKKRVHCMVKIWNIDIFEKDYNKGNLRYRHHNLTLSCRKEYCLESVNVQTIKSNKKKLIISLHVWCLPGFHFFGSYLKIDTHGPWTISVLTFDFNNQKCVILMRHASGPSVSV